MPEKFGHGRFNDENKYGDKSIKKAKQAQAKVYPEKGCSGNNHGPHWYVTEKTIVIHTVEKRNDYESLSPYCIFCTKKAPSSVFRKRKSLEVITTTVYWYGRYVPNIGMWGGYNVLKQKSYYGNTDKEGKEISN